MSLGEFMTADEVVKLREEKARVSFEIARRCGKSYLHSKIFELELAQALKEIRYNEYVTTLTKGKLALRGWIIKDPTPG